MEKMYWQNASAKTGLQNFDPAILILKMHHVLEASLEASWSWWRHNKGINWCKPANNNSWDRWEIKFIEFDRSWSFETPRFNFKVRHIGSSCSFGKKFVPSHWRLWFAFQTSRKWSIFEAHHHWGREMVYNNVKRKRSWSKKDEPVQSTSKADIHQKKVMLSVWWDFKGIVFFLSFYRTTQWSILKCTVISWTNWIIHLNRKGQNWSIEKV